MAGLLVREEHRGKAYRLLKAPWLTHFAWPVHTAHTPFLSEIVFFFFITFSESGLIKTKWLFPDWLNPSLSFLLQYMTHSRLQVVDGFILYFYCTLELRQLFFYIFIKQSYSGASLSKVRICCFFTIFSHAKLAISLWMKIVVCLSVSPLLWSRNISTTMACFEMWSHANVHLWIISLFFWLLKRLPQVRIFTIYDQIPVKIIY